MNFNFPSPTLSSISDWGYSDANTLPYDCDPLFLPFHQCSILGGFSDPNDTVVPFDAMFTSNYLARCGVSTSPSPSTDASTATTVTSNSSGGEENSGDEDSGDEDSGDEGSGGEVRVDGVKPTHFHHLVGFPSHPMFCLEISLRRDCRALQEASAQERDVSSGCSQDSPSSRLVPVG